MRKSRKTALSKFKKFLLTLVRRALLDIILLIARYLMGSE